MIIIAVVGVVTVEGDWEEESLRTNGSSGGSVLVQVGTVIAVTTVEGIRCQTSLVL